jgi:hypothetical protein
MSQAITVTDRYDDYTIVVPVHNILLVLPLLNKNHVPIGSRICLNKYPDDQDVIIVKEYPEHIGYLINV